MKEVASLMAATSWGLSESSAGLQARSAASLIFLCCLIFFKRRARDAGRQSVSVPGRDGGGQRSGAASLLVR